MAPDPAHDSGAGDCLSTEAEIKRRLGSWEWRLSHLYHIVDRDGMDMVFNPNSSQRQFLAQRHKRNVILKCRQRGFSTLIQLLMLDACLFHDNISAGVIAQSREIAATIFDKKIKYAYDHLPKFLRDKIPTTTDSLTELSLANGSKLSVGTSFRGDTLQWLHVSEIGEIAAKSISKAKELMAGTLQAAGPNCYVFFESTAKGREGVFWELCNSSRANSGKDLDNADYKFHFFPWYEDDRYSREIYYPIPEKLEKYFQSMEQNLGVCFTLQQRQWYASKLANDLRGDHEQMHQQYPTTPDEAFETSNEGCWFTRQVAQAYSQQRIGFVPWDPSVTVETYWDIGGDGTAVWFVQRQGGGYDVIDYYEDTDNTYSSYVNAITSRGYRFAGHWLPHDGDHHRQGETSNKSVKEMLENLGLENVECIPRIERKIDGYQMLRNLFPALRIDALLCAKGIVHIQQHSKKWDTTNARWMDFPEHDIHSHACDALRQLAQRESSRRGRYPEESSTASRRIRDVYLDGESKYDDGTRNAQSNAMSARPF